MKRLGALVTAAGLWLAVACAESDVPAAGPTTTDEVAAAVADTVLEPTAVPAVEPSTTLPKIPEPRSFTMAFTGDLLLHDRVNATAAAAASDDPTRDYDYRPQLAALGPLLEEADWAVCHLEVNLSADNTRLRPYPVFRAPGAIARDAREVGYDSCTTASNHVLDHGPAGVHETLEVLDAAGLAHTGSARSAVEAHRGIWIDVGDVRVAHLSYTYGFNGFSLPADAPWLSNAIDEDRILSDAARARELGAEYVVLSLHWGGEYDHGPNRQQRDLGPRLLASPDVDLIVGHHAHVVQPIDQIDGEWLVYGLGNLLSAYGSPVRRDQLLVRVTVAEQPDRTFSTELQATPLFLDHATLAVHPSSPTARPTGLGASLGAELDASWARVLNVLEKGSGWAELAFG